MKPADELAAPATKAAAGTDTDEVDGHRPGVANGYAGHDAGQGGLRGGWAVKSFLHP